MSSMWHPPQREHAYVDQTPTDDLRLLPPPRETSSEIWSAPEPTVPLDPQQRATFAGLIWLTFNLLALALIAAGLFQYIGAGDKCGAARACLDSTRGRANALAGSVALCWVAGNVLIGAVYVSAKRRARR